MSDVSGMFARYAGGDPEAEAAVERWFWPHLKALSQEAVVGTGCCRSCWHAYRKAEVVANNDAREFLELEFPGTAPLDVLDGVGEAISRLQLPPDSPDPVTLSRLVRDLVPGAASSPNYVLQIGNHPVLHPHFLPKPAPPETLRRSPGPSGVVVTVIDTGCIDDHTWWRNRVSTAHEEPPDLARPETLISGHGTFIVGLIRKLAPSVQVKARAVPLGAGLTEFAVAVEMVEAALRDHASVINVSLGTCPIDGLPPVAMAAAASGLDRDEHVIVASAGNDGTNHVVYPAAFPDVIGVGAVDGGNRRTAYSNFGSWLQACAQGRHVSSYFGEAATVTIDALGDFDGFAEWEGTSFATPVVAARIAAEVAGGGGLSRPSAGTVLARGGAVAGLGRLVS